MLLHKLEKQKLITPPDWLCDNTQFLCIVGSIAYGAADTTNNSDMDLFGYAIPPKEDIFPHLKGLLHGFDDIKPFQQFQQHHILDKSKEKEYDLSIFSIIKFFKLLTESNPSCIDMLFVPQECILHITSIGQMIRENRKLFLSKECYSKYKNYGYSMLHKIESKSPKEDSKRFALREKFGFDIKYGMHVVRLLEYAEQILATGDLDLRKNAEQLKSIRRGEMSHAEIILWASSKEKQLENLYHTSELPWVLDKNKIKKLLLDCINLQYNNLEFSYVEPDLYKKTLLKIREEIEKAGI